MRRILSALLLVGFTASAQAQYRNPVRDSRPALPSWPTHVAGASIGAAALGGLGWLSGGLDEVPFNVLGREGMTVLGGIVGAGVGALAVGQPVDDLGLNSLAALSMGVGVTMGSLSTAMLSGNARVQQAGAIAGAIFGAATGAYLARSINARRAGFSLSVAPAFSGATLSGLHVRAAF